MSETYPIRFFQLRDEDVKVVSGGSGEEPRFVLHGEELTKHLRHLDEGFDEVWRLYAQVRAGGPRIAPFVFTAKLDERAVAKTHREKVATLFGDGKTDGLIGIEGDDSLTVKIVSDLHLAKVQARLREPENSAWALSSLETIEPFRPKVERLEDGCPFFKLKVIDFQDENVNSAVRKFMDKSVVPMGVRSCRYSRKTVVYSVGREQVEGVLDVLQKSGVLLSCVPMPTYRMVRDAFVTGASSLPSLARESDRSYPRLGVLDGGIAAIPQLAPWIVGRNRPSYPNELQDADHGTMVAGTAVYGDILENAEWTGVREGVELFDATVMPCEDEVVSEDELIRNVQEALKDHHTEACVWNLSASMGYPIRDDGYSDLAHALDDLQDEYGILICKSAGNTEAYQQGLPRERLSAGADSVLSLTVGSAAHAKGFYDEAEIGEPSPFTRSGPGPEFTIKPEVAHYGGNAGMTPSREVAWTGVKTFSKDGQLVAATGTSLSTPRVSALAAGLAYELGGTAYPLLLKALIVHSARYPKGLKLEHPERTHTLGFGIPGTIQSILHDDPNAATLILNETLERGRFFEILDFPMPTSLIRDGHFTGQITVTMVAKPVLDPTQGGEYSQSNIDVFFGTYEREKENDTTKRNVVNPIGRDGVSANILKDTLYNKRKMAANVPFGRERMLVQFFGKYDAVKKWSVDLSEMNPTPLEKLLVAGRKWYLKVEGHFRQHTIRKAETEGFTPTQEFALIITVRDPERRGQVYNEMSQLLERARLSNNAAELRNEVEIRARG